MKKFFAQLRPLERRLAFGVLVVFILVLNYLFVWPRFSDWDRLQGRLATAQKERARNQAAKDELPKLQAQVKSFEKEGNLVAPEDQAINFLRTIQQQAAVSRVNIASMGRQTTSTNDAFFVQLTQNINVTANDAELVDFLYKLGSSASMIRVLDLELQPDPPRQNLVANITLVASYQKKPAAAAAPAAKTAKTAKTPSKKAK